MHERMFVIDKQKVILHDFDSPGYLLDIGGGGEGVIGKLKDERVVAIDIKKEELEEAPEGPLKIVMDARNLQFLNDTFNTVTSFFALMYVPKSDRKKVFREIYRVLKSDGQFLIWDVVIPHWGDSVKDIFVVRLVVTVHNEKIQTGYGVLWKDREQDIQYYVSMAEEIGFEVVKQEKEDQIYFLKLKKK